MKKYNKIGILGIVLISIYTVILYTQFRSIYDTLVYPISVVIMGAVLIIIIFKTPDKSINKRPTLGSDSQ